MASCPIEWEGRFCITSPNCSLSGGNSGKSPTAFSITRNKARFFPRAYDVRIRFVCVIESAITTLLMLTAPVFQFEGEQGSSGALDQKVGLFDHEGAAFFHLTSICYL